MILVTPGQRHMVGSVSPDVLCGGWANVLDQSVQLSESQRYGCMVITPEKTNRIEVRRYLHAVNNRPDDPGAGDILINPGVVGRCAFVVCGSRDRTYGQEPSKQGQADVINVPPHQAATISTFPTSASMLRPSLISSVVRSPPGKI